MWGTNLKILGIVFGTLFVYTAVANMIPQVESDVPEAVAIEADASPEELVAIGEELFEGAGGCTACHGLGTRAPDLIGVAGTACDERVEGMSCKEYLHESLVDPNAHVVEGFQPIMPEVSRTLGDQEIWALVAFLQSQGGSVTVTSEDLARADVTAAPGEDGDETAGGVGGAAAGAAGGAGVSAEDPVQMVQDLGCVACHQLDGEGAAVGPAFEEMRGKEREYLRRGILAPNADTAPGYAEFAGTMPPNFGERLTAGQLETLLDFLEEGGER